MRRLIGMAILLLGLAVALWPARSVWQLSNEVVAKAPDTEDLVSADTRWFPLADDDFILGTAVYEGVTAAEVSQQLSAAGFTNRGTVGQRGTWLSYPCCGGFDAALARTSDIGSGQVLIEFSAVDKDVQAFWWFFALIGLGIAFAGFVVFAAPTEPVGSVKVDTGERELV